MEIRKLYEKIQEKCAWDYMFRQLAEECSELSQAALKLVRSVNGETPVHPLEARAKYLEEMADVMIMIDLAMEETNLYEISEIVKTTERKMLRMMERLENGNEKAG